MSLTYEAGKAALKARAPLVEELRPLAQRVLELPAVDEYYEPESRAALHHLERWLFEPVPPQPIDPGSAVGLLESAGERAEAELVAAEVLSVLRDGVPGEEIAVVYRSLARVGPVVAHVLGRYGVAVAYERRTPFAHTALGRGVLALARCALLGDEEATAGDLLEYLRTPGVLGRPEKADKLEFEVIRERLATAVQARERLGFDLREIDAVGRSEDPGAELLAQARRLLSAPYGHTAPVLDPEQALDAGALGAMARALDELSSVQERVTGPELIELLEDVEVDSSVPGGPGVVTLAEPLAIRARRFRAVFVCGLQEGAFPRPQAPDPFLPDERRRELAAGSGLMLPLLEDALDRERYLFYASVSRATERVCLSYRSSDEEGNLGLASPFVADVADLMDEAWPATRRTRLLGDLVWSADQAPTDRERARAEVAERAAALAEPGERRLGPVALGHVRHTHVASAGGLESFSKCAFKWLVESELQPEQLAPDPDPLARGSYIHEVLEQLLSRLAAPVTPESLPRALELLEELTAELAPEVAIGRSEPLRKAAAASIAADLRRYLVREAADGNDWNPRHLELRFGFTEEEGGLPALTLGEEPEPLAVRGVIDRVDVDPSGRRAVVRDYKSGGARAEYQGARWSGDGTLQVPLYMLAVRQLLGLEPIAGLYQPLGGGGDPRARGVFLADAELGDGLVGTDARRSGRNRRRARGREPTGGRGRRTASLGGLHRVPGDLLAKRMPVPRDLPLDMTVAAEEESSPTSSDTRSRAATGPCSSTPPPAAARPPCSSSGSCARCSMTGSTSPRSSRSRSPTRRPPRCASGSGCGSGTLGALEQARATEERVHLDDPRILRPAAPGQRARRGDRSGVQRARRVRGAPAAAAKRSKGRFRRWPSRRVMAWS